MAPSVCTSKKNMEVEENVSNTSEASGTPQTQAQPGKKRKLNKYFRVHAHRNPLSDGEYEQYGHTVFGFS